MLRAARRAAVGVNVPAEKQLFEICDTNKYANEDTKPGSNSRTNYDELIKSDARAVFLRQRRKQGSAKPKVAPQTLVMAQKQRETQNTTHT